MENGKRLETCREKGRDGLPGERTCVQKALCEIATVLLQEVRLRFGLNAFGDYIHAETMAQMNDELHDRSIFWVLFQVADEGAVYLETVVPSIYSSRRIALDL